MRTSYEFRLIIFVIGAGDYQYAYNLPETRDIDPLLVFNFWDLRFSGGGGNQLLEQPLLGATYLIRTQNLRRVEI